MTSLKSGISRCGLCRFYNHEGRRGGSCSQLNAPVKAQWTACKLAASPFEPVEGKLSATLTQSEKWLVPATASELVAGVTNSDAIAVASST